MNYNFNIKCIIIYLINSILKFYYYFTFKFFIFILLILNVFILKY